MSCPVWLLDTYYVVVGVYAESMQGNKVDHSSAFYCKNKCQMLWGCYYMEFSANTCISFPYSYKSNWEFSIFITSSVYSSQALSLPLYFLPAPVGNVRFDIITRKFNAHMYMSILSPTVYPVEMLAFALIFVCIFQSTQLACLSKCCLGSKCLKLHLQQNKLRQVVLGFFIFLSPSMSELACLCVFRAR